MHKDSHCLNRACLPLRLILGIVSWQTPASSRALSVTYAWDMAGVHASFWHSAALSGSSGKTSPSRQQFALGLKGGERTVGGKGYERQRDWCIECVTVVVDGGSEMLRKGRGWTVKRHQGWAGCELSPQAVPRTWGHHLASYLARVRMAWCHREQRTCWSGRSVGPFL